MPISTLAFLLGLGVAGLVGTGCEKVDHDNIEKWSHTGKGPGKLRKALTDESIDALLNCPRHRGAHCASPQPLASNTCTK